MLIDTGTGGKLDNDPSFHGCGHLLENLRAAGFRPEQIDEVLMFPNAIVHVPKDEFSMILNAAETESYINRAHNKDFARGWIDFTTSAFAPYVRAGKLLAFEGDIEMVPGITALATHGYTPGHTSYLVESKGQTLIVMGDLVLVSGLQFHDPDLGRSFDSDPRAAAEQRRRILALAAAKGYWIAGSHLPFPGLGQVHAAGNGFSFSPSASNSAPAPPR